MGPALRGVGCAHRGEPVTLRVPLQEDGITSSQAILSVQSAVAAFRGTLVNVQADVVACTVPIRGDADKLAMAARDQDPALLVINVEVDVASSGQGTLLTFRSETPVLYFVSALHLDESTLTAFVTTVGETIAAAKAQHRPPDSPP
jgi:hypothetical protein